MDKQQLTYWMTLSQIPSLTTKRKNDIYVHCFSSKPRISIIQLFEDSQTWDVVGLDPVEKEAFLSAKINLTNNSFVVEDLLSQGYEIIPLDDQDYPQRLKDTLKRYCPSLMYIKGNKDLFKLKSFTVWGSRRPDKNAQQFSDSLSKRLQSKDLVLLSGYTSGTERLFLDKYLSAGGQAIIILTQGITKFSAGFTQYYKYVRQGKLLVVSFSEPETLWSSQNEKEKEIIYNMTDEFYIAQSKVNDSNWSDIEKLMTTGKSVYVRFPHSTEKSANIILIYNGAHALNDKGDLILINFNSRDDNLTVHEDNLLF